MNKSCESHTKSSLFSASVLDEFNWILTYTISVAVDSIMCCHVKNADPISQRESLEKGGGECVSENNEDQQIISLYIHHVLGRTHFFPSAFSIFHIFINFDLHTFWMCQTTSVEKSQWINTKNCIFMTKFGSRKRKLKTIISIPKTCLLYILVCVCAREKDVFFCCLAKILPITVYGFCCVREFIADSFVCAAYPFVFSSS